MKANFIIILGLLIIQSSISFAEAPATTPPEKTTETTASNAAVVKKHDTGSPLCDSYLTMVDACLKKKISDVWISNLNGDIKAIKESLATSKIAASSMCNYLKGYRDEDKSISQCNWKE